MEQHIQEGQVKYSCAYVILCTMRTMAGCSKHAHLEEEDSSDNSDYVTVVILIHQVRVILMTVMTELKPLTLHPSLCGQHPCSRHSLGNLDERQMSLILATRYNISAY